MKFQRDEFHESLNLFFAHHKIHFENFVVRPLHSQTVVSFPRGCIAQIHVKPQPTNVLLLSRQIVNVAKQRPKNPVAAKFLLHINTLNPPEISVAPIAPFTSDEQLAGDLAIEFRKKISPFHGIIQQRRDACAHARRFEFPTFSFLRDSCVKIRDNGGVG